MQIGRVSHNKKEYSNEKSKGKIQSQRLENYSDMLLDILEQYADEIGSTLIAYNKKSCEETMMIKGLRKSSQETTNRKTHMENLEGIAVEIAKKLGLREGVTRIIARNHDIGHTFLGHSGEWWLSSIKEEKGMGYYTHNALGPAELIYRHRIYDEILERIKTFNPDIKEKELKRIRKSLWLIFDGINTHNGEKTESEFIPDRGKSEEDFVQELEGCFTKKDFDKTIMPTTMEGCLLRLCDKISYIPYDMVDGLREGIIDKIDGEYIGVLTALGITIEEIENCNIRKNYELIARKLQIIFTKDVIENSTENAIKMSPGISFAMHELRNINNRRIVKYAVLQEDNDIYTQAIKSLMNRFSSILLQGNNLEELQRASENIDFARRIIAEHEGTPFEGFAKYAAGVTPEEYEFTERYLTEAEREAISQNSDNSYPDFKERLALEFGARYIATLNDFEFFDLIKSAGLITEEQAVSLTRKYKDIGQEGLRREVYVQPQYKQIMQEQERDTRGAL